MANFSALNKVVKYQKRWFLTNFHSLVRQQAATITNAAASNKHITLTSNKLNSCKLPRLVPQKVRQSPLQYYCTNSQATPIKPNIDDFRKREEQLEADFNRKQDEEDEKRKANESSSSVGDEDTVKEAKFHAARVKILEASLLHVPSLGWSRNAIAQGAEDVGYPGVGHGMFPQGGFELVTYYYGKCNDELVKQLRGQTQNGQNLDYFVSAIQQRLEMILPYKNHWPQAMGLIAKPQNVPTSLAQILTLVDDICYYSGDRSVDFAWYTRRIGLATIYKMTELYMMQDTSPEHIKTWEFLANRMEEAIQLQFIISQTGDLTQNVQKSFNSAFITARNILGIDYARQ